MQLLCTQHMAGDEVIGPPLTLMDCMPHKLCPLTLAPNGFASM